MTILQRGSPAPEVHHLRPLMTYSSPWRSMRARDVGGVGGGDVRLGHGEARADLARQQRFEPALLLLGRAVADQHFHVAGVRGRAVEHLRRHGRAAHDLAERRVFQVGQPGPVFAVRQEQVPQPRRLRLRLQLFHDRRDLPAIARRDLLVIGLLVGVDVLVHEGGEPLAQCNDFGRCFGKHGLYPSPRRPHGRFSTHTSHTWHPRPAGLLHVVTSCRPGCYSFPSARSTTEHPAHRPGLGWIEGQAIGVATTGFVL